MFRESTVFILVSSFFLGACALGIDPATRLGFSTADYSSNTEKSSAMAETRVELNDGAAIVVPANALQEEVDITIERNPDKIDLLPIFDETVVQLGDFYNFEVDGDLLGAVDLVLPFDESEIPEESGMLVAMIPNGESWKYIPVIADGDTVTLYTDNVGDPLIAWHFVCVEGKTNSDLCRDEDMVRPEDYAICDPQIALQVMPAGNGYQIVGQLVPAAEKYFGFERQTASNVSVTLELNTNGWRDFSESEYFEVVTDDQGNFRQSLPAAMVSEGWNWVFAKAECDPWFGEVSVESEGYTEFKVLEQGVEADDSELAEDAIPVGAVLLPDFTGQPTDDAIDWLTENDFGYTWMDGASMQDLGMTYDQAPAGDAYYLPHRTIVILYRTTEKVDVLGTWDFYFFWDSMDSEGSATMDILRDHTVIVTEGDSDSQSTWDWSYVGGTFTMSTDDSYQDDGETVTYRVEYNAELVNGSLVGTMSVTRSDGTGQSGTWHAEK